MRAYDDVQREIDERESGLGFGAAAAGPHCGNAAALLSSGRLHAPAAVMPPDLRSLYEERDGIGARELKETIDELKRRLVAAGVDEGVAPLVLLAYSLNESRTDALGQYMAATHAPALARDDWGRQVEHLLGAIPVLGRVVAMRAVEVVSSFEFPSLFAARDEGGG
ncbi:MAG: hypothetical protein ACJ74Q_15450 [Pyrinomonadaceae bacterium]